MTPHEKKILWVLGFATAAHWSCRPGDAAQLAMPSTPKGAEAVDGQCKEVSPFAEPLIVDVSASDRANIEVAMRDGLPVVAYTCSGMRVLPRCRANGSYQYFGVSTREQVVRLASADEVALNLPMAGVPLVARLRAELHRGSSLSIGMVLVGKRVAANTEIGRTDLVGECTGATHVVRGAHLGAFAMTTTTAASVGGAAEIMTAAIETRSSREKSVATRDGDLAACKLAKPDDESPPSACGAPVRLELLAVGRTHSSKAQMAVGRCPDGYTDSGGKCVTGSEALHTCIITNLDDCSRQCSAGDAESCVVLGYANEHAIGKSRNPAEAARLYQKGCDHGANGGCFYLALMKYNDDSGIDQDYSRAVELNRIACQSVPEACTNLAAAYERGHGVPKDRSRAVPLLARACRGGFGLACANLGLAVQSGVGTERDLVFAAQLFSRGCTARVPSACGYLAEAYIAGKGVTKDERRGAELRTAACDLGDGFACTHLARYDRANQLLQTECRRGHGESCWVLAQNYRAGRGVAVDKKTAAQLSMQACAKHEYHCSDAGIAHMLGDGVEKDVLRAQEFFKRACAAGDAYGCKNLGATYYVGDGVPKNVTLARQYFTKACDMKLEEACVELARLGAK